VFVTVGVADDEVVVEKLPASVVVPCAVPVRKVMVFVVSVAVPVPVPLPDEEVALPAAMEDERSGMLPRPVPRVKPGEKDPAAVGVDFWVMEMVEPVIVVRGSSTVCASTLAASRDRPAACLNAIVVGLFFLAGVVLVGGRGENDRAQQSTRFDQEGWIWIPTKGAESFVLAETEQRCLLLGCCRVTRSDNAGNVGEGRR